MEFEHGRREKPPKSIVILISGRGSNMRALLDAGLPGRICAVLSNDPAAEGLALADARGIPAIGLDHRIFRCREDFDFELARRIDDFQPDLVVLAGFLRILGAEFVARYRGRLMNIHPSLLPAFPGLHTHRRALHEGVKIHGCTVHLVTPHLDSGPVIIQAAVPVLPDDSEEILAARVLAQEHRIYPQAVRWFCEDRLRLTAAGVVCVEGAPVRECALISPELER